MCGRFTTNIDRDELMRYFELSRIEGAYVPADYFVPSQQIPVILGNNPRRLVFFNWGLVPSWSKDKTIGSKMFNARAETLSEKPSFRNLYRKRRCLVAADSFFEWAKEGTKKLPYQIRLKEAVPFAMAALWDSWDQPGAEPLHTCSIITTAANSLIQTIHDRMPLILPPAAYSLWLDPSVQDTASLEPLLKPYSSELMNMQKI